MRFDSSFARMIGAETDLSSFFSIASCLIFSLCFPPSWKGGLCCSSYFFPCFEFTWISTIWNKKIFFVRQESLNFYLGELNYKFRYLYGTPILCYFVWIYNSQPVKRKEHTKKGRNIFLTLWFDTGHCAFHYGFMPLLSFFSFLSYLCLLSLQKLYDTDVFLQWYRQVHVFFNDSKVKTSHTAASRCDMVSLIWA